MGNNRRYDSVGPTLDRLARDNEARAVPQGLTPEEVQLTGKRKDLREPVPCAALVQHRVERVDARQVDGEVIATTPGGAVLVRWKDERGHLCHAWLWGGAVRPR